MMLLDTHVWLRWLKAGNSPLPPAITASIEGSEKVAISSVSIWEAAYLARAGRVELDMPWDEWLPLATTRVNIQIIPLSGAIAARAAHLSLHHRDPADRFIIATAIEMDLQLLSLDGMFPLYEELAGRLVTS